MEDKHAEVAGRISMLQELTESKSDIQTRMKQNELCSRVTEQIDTKITVLQGQMQNETEVLFQCDTRQLEKAISEFGQLIKREEIPIDYSMRKLPNIYVGKKGISDGKLYWPLGVAVHENSQMIYVTDSGGISVFSMAGEYIDTICKEKVKKPSGIHVSEDNTMFVSDIELNCVCKFTIPDFTLVTKADEKGNGVSEFDYPYRICVRQINVCL